MYECLIGDIRELYARSMHTREDHIELHAEYLLVSGRVGATRQETPGDV